MNVLKRAFLYDTRKRGKSLTLFLLFTLITIFVTISFSVLSATQAAATNLRETVGASFTLRGKPIEFSAGETDFSMQFAPISQLCVSEENLKGHTIYTFRRCKCVGNIKRFQNRGNEVQS